MHLIPFWSSNNILNKEKKVKSGSGQGKKTFLLWRLVCGGIYCDMPITCWFLLLLHAVSRRTCQYVAVQGKHSRPICLFVYRVTA